jgi:small-conductance mechanosensitive channel
MKHNLRLVFFILFCFLTPILSAQDLTAPVLFKGDTLFVIKNNIGAFSAQQRAEMVQTNIRQLAKLPLSEFDSLSVQINDTGANIIYQNKVVASVTNIDATSEGLEAQALAENHKLVIRQALIDDYNDTSIGTIGKDFGLFILSLLVFLVVFRQVNKFFDYLRRNLKTLQRNFFFRNTRFIKFFQLITPETERSVLLFLLRMSRFTVLGLFLYFYLPFMFSQISYTRGFGEKLMEYILRPVRFIGESFTSFLPKLLFIIIIVIAVRYLINGLEYLARQVRTERLKFKGFYPDWAFPTFSLVRALIIIFTIVIIFPYLPGAGSDAFQGVSVFIGLLLSLGSAGAISNIISGIILTYMRPFKIGDRVKINDIAGDVISRNLLNTKVKTLKNEEITIPNAILLSGGIVNYTALTEEHGLILHTTITIGYDAPWKQVHELLIVAANQTELIDKSPEPFVLQKSLDDWYVAYEINAYTKESHKVPKIYSDLHANIQDVFNEAGLEIMSSHYMAVRDGNPMAVPQNHLPKDYKSPAFKVDANT